MTSPSEGVGGAASPPAGFPYNYTYRSVLLKSFNDTTLGVVAQRTNPDATVWMHLNVRDESRTAYILFDDGLARFLIDELNPMSWSIIDRPSFFWPKTSLPDAVSPTNLVDWGPFIPVGRESWRIDQSHALQEMVYPALVWWPELPYRGDRVPNSPVPAASQARTISYSRTPEWFL